MKNTDVLVLLQSKGVLTRPWVILELFTAITSNVPVVSLNVQNSYGYDYGKAMDFLLNFDNEIDIANPGAAELLREQGVDPEDVAYRLSDALPNIISTDFNPNGSSRQIQASLEDLADQMRQAQPIAPTMTKEEWLEKRKTSKSNSDAQPHGKGATAVASELSGTVMPSSKMLARVPETVPELPQAYLVRETDIEGLKSAVMSSGAGGTTLTSKHNHKKQQKVGAHGMGGVGKTTIAVALVNDQDIRKFFPLIVWASIGQDPDSRELQESIHEQLAGTGIPESATSDALRIKAMKDAAMSKTVLLVLDDVWDPIHEKALNCIDTENDSRLLVTTRIRGLLKNSAEVEMGVLPPSEALKLLLTSADIDADDIGAESEEHRIAVEIFELCGRLPLTLAIAGGMIADNPDGLTEDIVEIMKDGADLEDEEGHTLEERVIGTSLKMLARSSSKNKELAIKIFHYFAVFAEDVSIPAGVFNVLAPVLTNEKNEKKAKITTGNCLSLLLKYNLIKGSLAAGSGVFMHDVIRDFVINTHTAEGLRELQEGVVNTLLAARPVPEGFRDSKWTALHSLEGYVARNLHTHFRGSIIEGGEPSEPWLAHPDVIIKANLAMAVGLDTLVALSESHEAAGELVRAARISWVASVHKAIYRTALYVDMVHRTAELLERANDKEALDFELQVCPTAFCVDVGSERQQRVAARQKLISASVATFESKLAEYQAESMNAMMISGMFTGSIMKLFSTEAQTALQVFLMIIVQSLIIIDSISFTSLNHLVQAIDRGNHLFIEAGDLSDKPSMRNYTHNLWPYLVYSWFLCLSPMEAWDPTKLCDEEQNAEGIEFYDHRVCGRILKETWHFESARCYQCMCEPPLLLLQMRHAKCFAACKVPAEANWLFIFSSSFCF